MQRNLPEQDTKPQESVKPKKPTMTAEEYLIQSFMEYKKTHPQSSLFFSDIQDYFEKKEKAAIQKSKSPSPK